MLAVCACLLGWIAAASADQCRQIEAQLAALGPGSRAAPAQIARYDAAIATQQSELHKARERMRHSGCTPGASRGQLCASLDQTMQRMRSNLSDLERTRERMAGSEQVEARRRQFTAALSSQGCGAARTARGLPEPVEQAHRTTEGRSGLDAARSGTSYRTLCVRMCDGFFFPISHASPREQFAHDERLCAARCPGTRVELHFHRFPGEESDDMISVPTGTPYRQSENAFLYRQTSWERPSTCGCSPERGFDVVGGDRRDHDGEPAATAALPPEQPETGSFRRQGSFLIRESLPEAEAARLLPEPSVEPGVAVPEGTVSSKPPSVGDALDVDTVETPTRERSHAEGERDVRVVGPRFLPDPEEAIDLRVRDLHRAR